MDGALLKVGENSDCSGIKVGGGTKFNGIGGDGRTGGGEQFFGIGGGDLNGGGGKSEGI